MTREQFCVTLSLSDLDLTSWPTCPRSISWTAGESPDRSISQVVPSQSSWSSVTYSQGRVTSSPSLTTRTRTGCSVSAAGNRIRNTDSQCADRFHRDRPWVTTAEVKNTGTNRRRIKSKSETEVKCKLTCEVKLQSHYERHFNPHIFEHHVSVFSLLYFPSFSFFAIKKLTSWSHSRRWTKNDLLPVISDAQLPHYERLLFPLSVKHTGWWRTQEHPDPERSVNKDSLMIKNSTDIESKKPVQKIDLKRQRYKDTNKNHQNTRQTKQTWTRNKQTRVGWNTADRKKLAEHNRTYKNNINNINKT